MAENGIHVYPALLHFFHNKSLFKHFFFRFLDHNKIEVLTEDAFNGLARLEYL